MHESAVISNLGRTGIPRPHWRRPSVASLLKSSRSNESPGSGAAGDPPGIDVENLI